MKRAPLLAVCLLAAACGGPEDGRPAGDDKIQCAVEGASEFERVCVVERMAGAEGLVLTLRAPSGGFRRLLVTRDGRGVVAADGAQPARVTPIGASEIEVAIGTDRYRLPATVR